MSWIPWLVAVASALVAGWSQVTAQRDKREYRKNVEDLVEHSHFLFTLYKRASSSQIRWKLAAKAYRSLGGIGFRPRNRSSSMEQTIKAVSRTARRALPGDTVFLILAVDKDRRCSMGNHGMSLPWVSNTLVDVAFFLNEFDETNEQKASAAVREAIEHAVGVDRGMRASASAN